MTQSGSHNMFSHLQIGWVRHRRFSPKAHALQYPIFMLHIDLDELESVASLSRLISIERFNWMSFRRADFFGDPNQDLKDAVIDKICQHSTIKKTDIKRVSLLTNVRILGLLMNPVSFYYAFDNDDKLVAIMPEVTNTPWNERFQYVLLTSIDTHKAVENNNEAPGYLPVSNLGSKYRFKLPKNFHVSPFHPMNVQYDWRYSNPTIEKNSIHLENWEGGNKIFDATMVLSNQELTAKSIRTTIIRFPWMSVKIAYGIYINAVKLWLKGVPFYSHPNKSKKEKNI